MDSEKKTIKDLLGKRVVSKSGKIFGETNNVSFDVATGEILHLVIKNPTGYCEGLELEKTKNGEALVPFTAVAALGDFIVVSEEDML